MISEIRKHFASEDESVRRDAVMALGGELPSSEREDAAHLLVTAIKDTSWRVRKASVETLLEHYDPQEYLAGIERLLYEGGNAGARNSAIEAFTRLGARATDHLVGAFETDNPNVRKFIVDIVGEVGDSSAAPMLIKALKDENENVKASAVEHLGAMRDPSVQEALLGIIDSGDLWTSYPAVQALGNVGEEKHLPVFLSLLHNKMLREPALRALGKLGGEEQVSLIAPYLKDRSRAVQNEALVALAAIYKRGASGSQVLSKALLDAFGGEPSDMLLEYARSARGQVSDSAILLLGFLRDDRTLSALVGLTGDNLDSENIRETLVKISSESPESLMDLIPDRNAIETRFISDVMSEVASPVYFGVFVEMLGHDDGHVRSYAALGLARIGDTRAVRPLLKSLGDQYVDVQESVVHALVALREGLDIDSIVSLLKSDDPVLRRNAVQVLGEVGTSHVLNSLNFSLKDNDVRVRKAVVQALSSIGTDRAYDGMVGALADEDPLVRIAAVSSFGEAGLRKHIGSVCILLSDADEMVRASACKAMGQIGGQENVPELLPLIDDDNGYISIAAIEAIARLGGDAAKDSLLGQLSSQDPEKKRTALRSLEGFPGIGERLVPYLKDPDWATRVAAVKALSGCTLPLVRKSVEDALKDEDDAVVIKAFLEHLDA